MPLNRDGKKNPNNRGWKAAFGAAPGFFAALLTPLARHIDETDGVNISSQQGKLRQVAGTCVQPGGEWCGDGTEQSQCSAPAAFRHVLLQPAAIPALPGCPTRPTLHHRPSFRPA